MASRWKTEHDEIFSGRGYKVYSETKKRGDDEQSFRVFVEFGGNDLIIQCRVDVTDFFLFLSEYAKPE
jgi:hypothetical protein